MLQKIEKLPIMLFGNLVKFLQCKSLLRNRVLTPPALGSERPPAALDLDNELPLQMKSSIDVVSGVKTCRLQRISMVALQKAELWGNHRLAGPGEQRALQPVNRIRQSVWYGIL
ncbi:unnamed protein product [Effrenium voratum]|nr:unnamed protein product [Effrenium voratum]